MHSLLKTISFMVKLSLLYKRLKKNTHTQVSLILGILFSMLDQTKVHQLKASINFHFFSQELPNADHHQGKQIQHYFSMFAQMKTSFQQKHRM